MTVAARLAAHHAALAATLLLAACTQQPARAAPQEPSALQRDLADYATASCFAAQQHPYLKDQGQRWAGAVMQRAHGSPDLWAPVAAAVAAELGRTGIAQAQGDGSQAAPIPLPVMTCSAIAAAAPVRTAIDTAARALAADYAAQPSG